MSESTIDEVVAYYLEAIEAGEQPERERLMANHAHLADQLREFFRDLDGIQRFVSEKTEDHGSAEELVLLGRSLSSENHERIRRFVKKRELAAQLTSTQKTLDSKHDSSRTIGPYKMLQQIGAGGMGEVWMAEQLEPVRRRVALKLIKAGMDSKQVIARFQAERQALAMMDHQNIARVLDAGTTDTGRPYFVMELVQGIPITKYCDRNKLSIQQRLELFVPICHAVQHAHQKGIIHRDLKPSNILVTLYDGKPVPKVIDFGLAKALQHQSKLTDKTLFTEFGQVVGTLQYMSPEQAEMNALDIDTRTDIYSLGAMLYETLTGSTPIERETFEKEALLKVIETIREADPPRPSSRLSSSGDAVTGISKQRQIEPRKLMQVLRGDLDWIVMKTLEKDRTRRYATANDFASDIQHYLDGEAVEARPPSTAYLTKKFITRNRGLVTTAAAFALLLLVGITASTRFGILAISEKKRADGERDKAEIARKSAVDAMARAERGETQAMQELLSHYHTGAESKLARARQLLAEGGEQDLHEKAATELAEAGLLRNKASATLAKLGSRADEIKQDEQNTWSRRLIRLRNEASRVVTDSRLQRIRVVRLGTVERSGWNSSTPAAVMTSDRQTILTYTGGEQIVLLKVNGGVTRRIRLPRHEKTPKPNMNRPAMALSPDGRWLAAARPEDSGYSSVTEILVLRIDGSQHRWLSLPEREYPSTDKLAQIAFPDDDVVEYEGYAWTLSSGEVTEQTNHSAPGREKSENRAQVTSAEGELEAIWVRSSRSTASVSVRRVSDGAAVVAMPHAAAFNADPPLMQFSDDLSSLFVASGDSLVSIDLATGKSAQITVGKAAQSVSKAAIKRLLPWQGGIITVERLQGARSTNWQLSYWSTVFPGDPVQAIGSPQPISCLATSDDLVVTGSDNTVRGWRDGKLLWASGSGATSESESQSYPWWDFAGTDHQHFLLERQKLLPGGTSRVVTELYQPDGELIHSFPVDGKGRLIGTRPDRELAVMVANVAQARQELSMYSLAENRSLVSLGEHRNQDSVVTFSPDGRWLLIQSKSKLEFEVWDTEELKRIGKFKPRFAAFEITFVPEQPWLISADHTDSTSTDAELFDLQTASKICDLQGLNRRFFQWHASEPTATLLGIWGDKSSRLRVTAWDIKSGEAKVIELGNFPWGFYLFDESVLTLDRILDSLRLRFNEAGTRLLVAGSIRDSVNKTRIQLWNLDQQTLLRSHSSSDYIRPLRLIEGQDAETVNLIHESKAEDGICWRWSDGQDPPDVVGLKERNRSIVFDSGKQGQIRLSANGLVLHRSGVDPLVLADTASEARTMSRHRRSRSNYAMYSKGASLAEDGSAIAIFLPGWRPGLWNSRSGELIARFDRDISIHGFDARGRWFVTSDASRKLTIWDVSTGEPHYMLRLPENARRFQLKVHPGGRHAVVQSQGTLFFFDAATGSELATIKKPGHVGPVRCLADGQEVGLVASAGLEGVVLLWERETGQLHGNLRLNMPGISQLGFSPDGKRLAATAIANDSDQDHDALALFDLQGNIDWEIDTTHRVSQPSVFAFHPGGEFLAVGSIDGKVLLVDSLTGKVIGLHQGEPTSITALAFSSDGNYLATANESGRVYVWDHESVGPSTSWDNGSVVAALKFLGSGRVLATAGQEIRLRDIGSNTEILRLRLSNHPAVSIGYGQSTRALLCHDTSGAVVSLSLEKLEQFFQELNLGGTNLATLTSSEMVTENSSWDSVLDQYRRELREQWLEQDLDSVAELLLNAEPKQFATLFPEFAAHGDQALSRLNDELDRELSFNWKDKPLDSSWSEPTKEVKERLKQADGMITDRFAFCQTLPLDELQPMTEELGKSGFRPIRLRPYAHNDSVQVAAAWTRDGKEWRLSTGQAIDAIDQQDDEYRDAGFTAVDAAGYIGESAEARAELYAALWTKKSSTYSSDAHLYVGASYAEHKAVYGELEKEGYSYQQSLQGFRGLDGQQKYCGVRYSISGATRFSWHQSAAVLDGKEYLDKIHWDIDPSMASDTLTTKDRYEKALADAEARLKSEPDDANSRYSRGNAHFYLGNDEQAMEDFNYLIENHESAASHYRFRAVLHARLGHSEEARMDLAKFSEKDKSASNRAYVDMIVSAHLEEESDGRKRLEEFIELNGEDTGALYNAACAYAICSRVFEVDAAKSKVFADRAVDLIRQAILKGYKNYSHMQQDPDLDPLRGRTDFAEIMTAANLDIRYAAIWKTNSNFVSLESHGLSPTEHLAKCRQIEAKGYRIASISSASIAGEIVTASVWHRPNVTDDEKETLASRQANAAIASFRMGDSDQFWRLLKYSPDPRLRTWIIHRFGLTGASAERIVQRLDSESDSSVRRSLVSILGRSEAGPQIDRDTLSATLLSTYRNDPDFGVHAAAGWALGKRGKTAELAEIDTEIATGRLDDKRNWYLSTQDQTMVVIPGPVDFMMGSPPTARVSIENLHRKQIPHSFAIASKEVTVRQFQEFLRQNPSVTHTYNERHASGESNPQTSVTWYEAAAYCRWLSEQERIPENQMCYPPISEIKEGLTMPQDYLTRTGYRLPTEAEWEYACRSRSVTGRHYGESDDLLEQYAHTANYCTLPVGSLMPNDTGLFDMLGNVSEWCQEHYLASDSARDMLVDREDTATVINAKPRVLRGAGFATNESRHVRSASRDKAPPDERNRNNGFRIARTHDSSP